MTPLLVAQLVHLIGALAFAGGQIVMNLVVMPALLRLPATQARQAMEALGPHIARLMGAAALLTLGGGIVRGVVLGPLRSADALLHTSYGHAFLGGLIGMVLMQAWGIGFGGYLRRNLWDGDAWSSRAGSLVTTSAAVTLGLLLAVICTMIAMRFGL